MTKKKTCAEFKYSLYREGNHIREGYRILKVTKADAKDGYYEQCNLICEEESLNDFNSLGVTEGDKYYELKITNPDNSVSDWECNVFASVEVQARLI